MHIDFSPDDLAFRDEVRGFLGDKFTPDLREAAARQTGVFAEPEVSRRWHHILYEQGWVAPAWPKEYGGTGWSPVQKYIFDSECAEAGTPSLPAMGLQMCGPVLIGHGTDAQKAHHLPRILSGEHYWCQGYSEPQSGSDLASLQCRAVSDGVTVWSRNGDGSALGQRIPPASARHGAKPQTHQGGFSTA